MPTLIALDLILSLLLSLFYHPSLQLSFISLFLFFHSSTPSLFPRAHIFIEPSRPWTSAHCNNAIRQGDCVAFKVCVCVRKCETLCSQNRQSGPLSYTAHALMCKPLVTVLLPEGTPGATRVTWLCVCVCVQWGGKVGVKLKCLSWHH